MLDKYAVIYLERFTKRNLPEISATLEALSAQRAYNSLNENEKIDYGVFSKNLDPLFFYLDERELNLIEETLPPYPHVASYIYKKKLNLNEEEIKLLCRKSDIKSFFSREGRKARKSKQRLLSRVTPEEYKIIQKAYEKEIWYDFRKALAVLYAESIVTTYFTTHNPYALLPWIVGIAPYYALCMLSYRVSNKKLSSALRKAAVAYFYARYGPAALESVIEFGVVAPMLGEAVDKTWLYTPKTIRKILFKTGEFLSGVKRKKFDEKEIRQELYSLPDIVSNHVHPRIVEHFKEKIENGEIEVEDTGKTLFKPFILGYYRRPAVIRNGKIVDKRYVRKLAAKEGAFLEDFKCKIVKRPWEYLGFDVDYSEEGVEIVWVRDVIGITPSKRQGLYKGVIRKEGYLALLGTKADEIFRKCIISI